MVKKPGLALPRALGRRLLEWASTLDRPLPWREERDPYRIWLSEMLCQQTRAEQAIPYYERFLRLYPDVHALAKAPDDQVLKAWEGLGYYNRAHNLLRTARKVSGELGGQFPSSVEELMALPGIGPYSAAAIASFAWDLRHPVVDGNVIRVLSRLSGYEGSVHHQQGKRLVSELAVNAMQGVSSARFNQAIMDFGATICLPRRPRCGECPFHRTCVARRADRIAHIPLKKVKKPLQKRYFLFLMARQGDSFYIVQRGEDDIWRKLYTLPSQELEGPLTEGGTATWNVPDRRIPALQQLRWEGPYRQILSHQLIHGYFAEVTLPKHWPVPDRWGLVTKRNFTKFAFPKLIKAYLLSQNGYL
jgi:A/G-specific adenine glycosylase